jgi:hypothetical protein
VTKGRDREFKRVRERDEKRKRADDLATLDYKWC